ncbi:xanthine dehydrogenase molybdopterin binding subunit [Pseudobacteriovorax antillogorgiicola]|uniref:Xanthine dehydrogenase, molybdenum binding subunit apoprotein n=1 Tax=Pseudobacteriovorax antillogorgiicola TaxID=1513793 RepID=A0A1Y6C8N1_9BACT|nr:xanthine dehydrogenase molybdopterin binding subunit [Pseudobacteriovorax antillogorgiicola]TCS49771.1 xanthine dehydrogenase molybdenum binding subunit apoprotein [Pseudobacteriovorax antillogorgiicola]SMF42742.1 xanthine dehydrogenase, molybdenum binding subunit apoprotein [Pseudobacteriovorax antillogorgiicola]
MDKSKAFHDSALTHVTGESLYVEDIPPVHGECFVGVVVSPIAKGQLLALDPSAALNLEGVYGFFTAKDLKVNQWGPILHDQPLLVDDRIEYLGEPLAIVVADTPHLARQAAALVEVKVKADQAILDIVAAKAEKHFYPSPMLIERGDVDQQIEDAKNVLEGSFYTGGQEHFYLESQSVIVYPQEGGDILVHSSTQHPSEVQHTVAHALGLGYSQVVCEVKRMGGAFGGKESQSTHFAVLCALAAKKLGRVCRLHLSKDEDMAWTGKRHAFHNDYKVAFEDDGVIRALDIQLYNDGGAYLDLSAPILQRAMLHVDNAYYLEHARIKGTVCKTNYPPNTAFRGFGGPQGVMQIESIIEDIAFALKMDAADVRRRNLYGIESRNTTPYEQKVENNLLPELFDQIMESSDYKQRRAAIETHNQTNPDVVRGIALTPVKFGISFTVKFLNQGNALVNVHRDGTIQVSTGATEMGQGVNTKIAVIVAEAFGVSYDRVKVMTTSTEKNHNTSATAASSGSDINGYAALIACENILKPLTGYAAYYLSHPVDQRPNPILELHDYDEPDHPRASDVIFENDQVYLKGESNKGVSFAHLVDCAYHNRVSLGAYGHYKTKDIHYDRQAGRGQPFLYYTQGMAVTEVRVDTLTGDVKMDRVDILMELGRSIQEGIDYGQIAGGFIQGCGWAISEELVYDQDGRLLSHSPTTYKIPNIQDTPREFHIKLVENPTKHSSVKGSKAVGEPPFLLCASPWAAIKNALQQKTGSSVSGFKLPATAEEVLRQIYPAAFEESESRL